MTQRDPEPRFRAVTSVKATGSTYTPPALAAFVAGRVAELTERLHSPGAQLRVLDPAVGDGELLVQLVGALRHRGFHDIVVVGFDIDEAALVEARRRLVELRVVEVELTHADFLSVTADRQELGMDGAGGGVSAVDVVIANPPYVRTQVLGEDLAQSLARRHGLTGRVDLYQAFMVTLSDWLRGSGIAGVITSNRFLTVRSGQLVRRHLWNSFRVHHVWDLGDTRCFGAAVLPAVTLLEKPERELGAQGSVGMTTIYETSTSAPGPSRESIFDALAFEGVVGVGDRAFEVRQGRVQTDLTGRGVWRLSNPTVETWLGCVADRTWKTFGQVGKIRVGIKTTADSVFIRDDWAAVGVGVPELLRPLTTHHIGRRYKALPTQKAVLYTHEVVGGRRRAVDLASHPVSAAYLQTHKKRLERRKYLTKAKRNWFEIWVPQDPSQWPMPKLVFRDIAEEPQFWIDLSGTVINGDCYWMVAGDGDEDLLWLALAVGNSRFICDFYDRRFNNKLYAGRRRFITQYVTQFPLPDPGFWSSRELIRLAREAYEQVGAPQMEERQAYLDELVYGAFGVSPR